MGPRPWMILLVPLAAACQRETPAPTGAAAPASTSAPAPVVSAPPPRPRAPERPVELLRFSFTSEVKAKEPADQLEQATPGQRVYAHFAFKNQNPEPRMVHVVFRVNSERRTTLDLKVASSLSYRTWAFNTLKDSDRGQLTVEVTGDDGAIIVSEKLPIGARKGKLAAMVSPRVALVVSAALAPLVWSAVGQGAPPAPSGGVAASAAVAAMTRPAMSGHGPEASARPLGSAAASVLPPGHPPTEGGAPPSGEGLPPGHPTTAQPDTGGRFRMPMQSSAQEDPSLPPGTIAIYVRDGEGNPLADREINLGIVENSIAKGESRQHRTVRTDAAGQAQFAGLDTASSFAYRVTTVRDSATYAATPFNLPRASGMRVVLFAYPVTTNVDQAQIAAQGIVYLELRDEMIQVEQAYRAYNLGQNTWLATGVDVALPTGFKAFNAQRSMSDQVWDGTPTGARFHGTLAPGQHDTSYRFQLPAPEGDELTLDLGILPHVQAFRVIVDAPRGLELDVDGFPAAQPSTNGQGQRVLITEKELPRLDPGFRKVHIRLAGLPTRPKGRWYALALALAALGIGLTVALRTKPATGPDPAEAAAARQRLLAELEKLEKDRAAGEVGPRTYEAARRAMLDALARLLPQ